MEHRSESPVSDPSCRRHAFGMQGLTPDKDRRNRRPGFRPGGSDTLRQHPHHHSKSSALSPVARGKRAQVGLPQPTHRLPTTITSSLTPFSIRPIQNLVNQPCKFVFPAHAFDGILLRNRIYTGFEARHRFEPGPGRLLTARHARDRSQVNRRPRGGEIPRVWSSPPVKVAALNNPTPVFAGRICVRFFQTR